MNENLAYWQLDFTLESQANLAPDCMATLLGYFTPRPTAFGKRPKPTSFAYFQIFSSKPGLVREGTHLNNI